MREPNTGIPELDEMVNVLGRAPRVYQPSRYWEGLVTAHVELIRREGLTRFKQTLNNSYFQLNSRYYWRAFPRLLAALLRRPSLVPFRVRTRVCDVAEVRPDWLLPLMIGLLYMRVREEDDADLLSRLREPSLGCPTIFVVNGHEITQDLCHSVSEFSFFGRHLHADANVAEFGAGYGRLAYVVLGAMPGVRYYVIDIPPALFVSQTYLSSVYPAVPMFRFREFRSFSDVADEMDRARVVFLEPQQLEMLPDDHFDACITISTLDEMTDDQVVTYLRAIDRLCRGIFYMKQWQVAHNPFDDRHVREDEYPVPSRWRLLRRRTAIVPARMFERLYACRPSIPDRGRTLRG